MSSLMSFQRRRAAERGGGMNPGTKVEHPEYGPGTIARILGAVAVVNFFGEEIQVAASDLKVSEKFRPRVVEVADKARPQDKAFRRAFEAVNLGVVPPDPAALVAMTIGGEEITRRVESWLDRASEEGLCKAVFGDYGYGKSHFLHVVRAVALQAGWVVSFVEFDPKAADPAKPLLVYREILSKMQFPAREDGSQAAGFRDFLMEVRRNWEKARSAAYLRENPWFWKAFQVLLRYPPSEEPSYVQACDWLAGQPVDLKVIQQLAREQGLQALKIPRMPQVKEVAEIYVFHLVVMSSILKAIGYKGLLVLLDEAEHVRGYTSLRRGRAHNFFDLLARSSMPPLDVPDEPFRNEHGFDLPPYWKKGPHLGLFVGLTEGNTFAAPGLPLREACVFLHRREDRIRLEPPTPEQYEEWCTRFFENFHRYRPESTAFLSMDEQRRSLAGRLRAEFEALPEEDRVIRIWVKLASLVPSMVLAGRTDDFQELGRLVQEAARKISSYVLPWEEN